MSIITLSKAKTLLGITDTASDSKISALIPLVEQTYLDVRNAPWETIDGVIIYPQGSEYIASDMIAYKLSVTPGSRSDVSSESVGSYSVSFSGPLTRGYPGSIISQIKRYIRGL